MQEMRTNGQLKRIAPVARRHPAQRGQLAGWLSPEVNERHCQIGRKIQSACDKERTVRIMAIVVRRQVRGWRIGGRRVVVAVRARMRTSRVIGWLESRAVRMMGAATQHEVQVDGQRGDDGDDGTH